MNCKTRWIFCITGIFSVGALLLSTIVGAEGTKEKPTIRYSPLKKEERIISPQKLDVFLDNIEIATIEAVKSYPTLFYEQKSQLLPKKGGLVYSHHLPETAPGTVWVVYRKGPLLFKDSRKKKAVAHVLREVAKVQLLAQKDGQSSFKVIDLKEEVQSGDLLVYQEPKRLDIKDIHPRIPSKKVGGQVLSAQEGVSIMGPYSILTLTGGENVDRKPGDLLTISRVYDKKIPEKDIGKVLVVRVFPTFSLGFVLESQIPLEPKDRIQGGGDGSKESELLESIRICTGAIS
jgi:hypothetical protein